MMLLAVQSELKGSAKLCIDRQSVFFQRCPDFAQHYNKFPEYSRHTHRNGEQSPKNQQTYL